MPQAEVEAEKILGSQERVGTSEAITIFLFEWLQQQNEVGPPLNGFVSKVILGICCNSE